MGVGLATAAVLPTAAGAATTLKMGTFSASSSPWADAMRKFADVVKTKTNDQYEIAVYTDAQLGDMQQLLTGTQLGTIDMAYFDVSVAAFLKGAEPLKVLIVPYLFDSPKDAARILNSDLFKGIYDQMAEKTGVRVFAAYGDRSPRAIQTTRGPIMKPEDLKGMRLRVPGIDVYQDTFETLGAKVTPLGMTEIYNALSRGIVEGQDNGFDVSLPLKFQEVAKYWSATDQVYAVTGWFISDRLWKSMSPETQAAFIEAAKQGGAVATEETDKLDAQGPYIIKQAGGTYVVPDREAFKKALANVYKDFEGKVWPDGLVEKIKAMQGH